MTERDLLTRTAEIAADYLESLDIRGVGPTHTYREMHTALDAPVPDGLSDATEVIEELAASLDPDPVSGWRTTTEDVDRTVAAFARALG